MLSVCATNNISKLSKQHFKIRQHLQKYKDHNDDSNYKRNNKDGKSFKIITKKLFIKYIVLA